MTDRQVYRYYQDLTTGYIEPAEWLALMYQSDVTPEQIQRIMCMKDEPTGISWYWGYAGLMCSILAILYMVVWAFVVLWR